MPKSLSHSELKALDLKNQLLDRLPLQPTDGTIRSILDDKKPYADGDDYALAYYLRELASKLPLP